MRENNRGSMIILTVIGIATLLVAVIGATFAYFTVTIKYETDPTPAVIQSSTMLIQFKTLNELTYTGAIPGRPSLSSDPIAQNIDNKLSFSLTSAPNMTSSTKYNVYLVIDSNDFETDNLVYLMTQKRDITSEAQTNGTTGSEGSEYIADDSFTMDDIDGEGPNKERKVGTIKSELKAGDKKLIATGNLGSHGSVDTWEFEIWLRETGVEQNEDQGKTLKAHIEVEPIDQNPVTFEPDKVTTP
jgi:hypothetical protein